MLLTLWVNALKSRMAAPGGRGLTVLDIPKVARDELGLSGLVMTTELLAGADRTMLSRVHEAADKAHCPILVLSESRPLPLASRDAAQDLRDRLNAEGKGDGRVVTAE